MSDPTLSAVEDIIATTAQKIGFRASFLQVPDHYAVAWMLHKEGKQFGPTIISALEIKMNKSPENIISLIQARLAFAERAWQS